MQNYALACQNWLYFMEQLYYQLDYCSPSLRCPVYRLNIGVGMFN